MQLKQEMPKLQNENFKITQLIIICNTQFDLNKKIQLILKSVESAACTNTIDCLFTIDLERK